MVIFIEFEISDIILKYIETFLLNFVYNID